MFKRAWGYLLKNLSVILFVLFVWGLSIGISLPGETISTFQIMAIVIAIMALASYPFSLLLLDKLEVQETSCDEKVVHQEVAELEFVVERINRQESA